MARAGESVEPGPVGLSGWLVLPLLGLVLTLLTSYRTLAQYGAIPDALARLTPPQSAFLVAEAACNAILLVLMPIMLLVLAVQKKRSFPTWYIRWAIAGVVFLILDLAIAKYLFPERFPTVASLFDEGTVRELIRSAILLAVWVPYMQNSRRVANTFIN